MARSNESNQSATIARLWHGWTTLENATKLEHVLQYEAIPGIEAKRPKRLKGINLLTLRNGDEVMFTTIMYFDNIESVKGFAGEDYSQAHIDAAVLPLLLRYDERVEHHAITESKTWQ